MVSRCGCSGGCACYVIGGNGVNVVGNGSITAPYLPQVSFTKPGSLACTRFMHDCGPSIVGDGLQWNDPGDFNQPGTISLKISSTAGNLAKIGSDGGLYIGAGSTTTLSCTRDVSQLGAGTVFGRGGIGVNTGPLELIRAVRMAQAVGADGVFLKVHMTADRVPIVAPYTNFDTNWTYDACVINPGPIGGVSSCGTRYTGLPYPSYLFDTIGLPQWKNLLVSSQDWFAPTMNNQWGANTVTEVLDEMAGKMNFAWYIVDDDFYNAADKQILRQKMVEYIKKYCAEKSSILVVSNYTYLSDFTGSGIDTGVYIGTAAEMSNSTAARCVAAGAKWAFLNYQLKTNTEFVKYQQAGLKTMAVYATRKNQYTEMTSAPYNLLGVVSDDVTYTTGKFKGQTRDLWGYGTFPTGQIHEPMDYAQYRTRLRGYGPIPGLSATYQNAWFMPPMDSTETVRQLTLGWATPFPSAALTAGNNLLIQWEQLFWPDMAVIPSNDPCSTQPVPTQPATSAGLGIAILMDTDQPATDVRTQLTPVRSYEPPTSYTCIQTYNGDLTISGRLNGAPTTPTVVNVGDPGGQPGQGSWVTMQIILTPTKIVFRRMGASGELKRAELTNTNPTEAANMRTNLSTRYLAIRKTKASGAADFFGAFRHLSISLTANS